MTSAIIAARRSQPRFLRDGSLLSIGCSATAIVLPRTAGEAVARRTNNYRLVSRQPAASASSTEQNQRVPLLIFIWIFAYQRLVGW